jgi:hypothetical protein
MSGGLMPVHKRRICADSAAKDFRSDNLDYSASTMVTLAIPPPSHIV